MIRFRHVRAVVLSNTGLFVMTSFALVAVVLVAVWSSHNQQVADRRFQATTRAEHHQSQLVAHDQCERGNDRVIGIRRSEADIVGLIFATRFPGSTPRPPQVVKALADLAARVRQQAKDDLPTVDCNKAAPVDPYP